MIELCKKARQRFFPKHSLLMKFYKKKVQLDKKCRETNVKISNKKAFAVSVFLSLSSLSSQLKMAAALKVYIDCEGDPWKQGKHEAKKRSLKSFLPRGNRYSRISVRSCC